MATAAAVVLVRWYLPRCRPILSGCIIKAWGPRGMGTGRDGRSGSPLPMSVAALHTATADRRVGNKSAISQLRHAARTPPPPTRLAAGGHDQCRLPPLPACSHSLLFLQSSSHAPRANKSTKANPHRTTPTTPRKRRPQLHTSQPTRPPAVLQATAPAAPEGAAAAGRPRRRGRALGQAGMR